MKRKVVRNVVLRSLRQQLGLKVPQSPRDFTIEQPSSQLQRHPQVRTCCRGEQLSNWDHSSKGLLTFEALKALDQVPQEGRKQLPTPFLTNALFHKAKYRPRTNIFTCICLRLPRTHGEACVSSRSSHLSLSCKEVSEQNFSSEVGARGTTCSQSHPTISSTNIASARVR